MIQIARRFPGYSHGNRWQCNDSIHCQPRLHRFGSCTEVRHQTALLQNAYVELYRDQTQTIGYSLAETRPARSFVFVCDKKVTGRWKSCWKLKDRRKGVGSEVDSRYIQSKIIKLLYHTSLLLGIYLLSFVSVFRHVILSSQSSRQSVGLEMENYVESDAAARRGPARDANLETGNCGEKCILRMKFVRIVCFKFS